MNQYTQQSDVTTLEGSAAKPKSIFANLDDLRLSVGEATWGATTEILSKVPVRKPQRQEFVRVHPDESMMLAAAVYEDKLDREFYFVAPNMMSEMSGETVPVILVVAISRQNVVFLWPIKIAGDSGLGSDWQETARIGCETAKSKWVRLAADMSLGGYRIWAAQGDLPEPEWPKKPLNELLEIAFRGRVIDNEDHPIIKRLRGLV